MGRETGQIKEKNKRGKEEKKEIHYDHLFFVLMLMIFCFYSAFFYSINEVEGGIPGVEIRRLLSRLLAVASENIRSRNLFV